MIVILDNGHGGMIAGKYQTDPKTGKFFVHADGMTIHEGEFNRAVKARVIERLYNKGIPYFDLVPEQEDIPLQVRSDRANAFHAKNGQKTFLISIHADAFQEAQANDSTCLLHLKHSIASMQMAVIAKDLYSKHFPERKHRGIKTQNLHICRETNMPAMLLENFFMTNYHDCKNYLKNPSVRDRIADYIVEIIETVIKNYA